MRRQNSELRLAAILRNVISHDTMQTYGFQVTPVTTRIDENYLGCAKVKQLFKTQPKREGTVETNKATLGWIWKRVFLIWLIRQYWTSFVHFSLNVSLWSETLRFT